MSIPTLTAARIYMSQLKNERGKEQQLSFDKFPYVGLSKVFKWYSNRYFGKSIIICCEYKFIMCKSYTLRHLTNR